MSDRNFPDECLRGIQGEDKVEGLLVDTDVFNDWNRSQGEETLEQSINWNDDGGAVELTLSQCKQDGSLKHRGGIAVVPIERLDSICRGGFWKGILTYERAELENNEYHGNLRVSADVPKRARKQLAAALAVHVTRVIPQD